MYSATRHVLPGNDLRASVAAPAGVSASAEFHHEAMRHGATPVASCANDQTVELSARFSPPLDQLCTVSPMHAAFCSQVGALPMRR